MEHVKSPYTITLNCKCTAPIAKANLDLKQFKRRDEEDGSKWEARLCKFYAVALSAPFEVEATSGLVEGGDPLLFTCSRCKAEYSGSREDVRFATAVLTADRTLERDGKRWESEKWSIEDVLNDSWIYIWRSSAFFALKNA